MNHTGASINMHNGIEKHDLSILNVMLIFTYMNSSSIRKSSSSSSSSSISKAMLVITVVVIRIRVLLLDRSTNE